MASSRPHSPNTLLAMSEFENMVAAALVLGTRSDLSLDPDLLVIPAANSSLSPTPNCLPSFLPTFPATKMPSLRYSKSMSTINSPSCLPSTTQPSSPRSFFKKFIRFTTRASRHATPETHPPVPTLALAPPSDASSFQDDSEDQDTNRDFTPYLPLVAQYERQRAVSARTHATVAPVLPLHSTTTPPASPSPSIRSESTTSTATDPTSPITPLSPNFAIQQHEIIPRPWSMCSDAVADEHLHLPFIKPLDAPSDGLERSSTGSLSPPNLQRTPKSSSDSLASATATATTPWIRRRPSNIPSSKPPPACPLPVTPIKLTESEFLANKLPLLDDEPRIPHRTSHLSLHSSSAFPDDAHMHCEGVRQILARKATFCKETHVARRVVSPSSSRVFIAAPQASPPPEQAEDTERKVSEEGGEWTLFLGVGVAVPSKRERVKSQLERENAAASATVQPPPRTLRHSASADRRSIKEVTERGRKRVKSLGSTLPPTCVPTLQAAPNVPTPTLAPSPRRTPAPRGEDWTLSLPLPFPGPARRATAVSFSSVKLRSDAVRPSSSGSARPSSSGSARPSSSGSTRPSSSGGRPSSSKSLKSKFLTRPLSSSGLRSPPTSSAAESSGVLRASHSFSVLSVPPIAASTSTFVKPTLHFTSPSTSSASSSASPRTSSSSTRSEARPPLPEVVVVSFPTTTTTTTSTDDDESSRLSVSSSDSESEVATPTQGRTPTTSAFPLPIPIYSLPLPPLPASSSSPAPSLLSSLSSRSSAGTIIASTFITAPSSSSLNVPQQLNRTTDEDLERDVDMESDIESAEYYSARSSLSLTA